MAVVPGFSVSDLIQATGHIKTVYDGFFDKYRNSAAQIRELADHIQQFQANLEAHKEIIQSRGLLYSGYVAIKRTLDECEDFLNKYKAVLDKKISVEWFWRTGRFQYQQDTVARLQKQIESHAINILHFNLNILLNDHLRTERTERKICAIVPAQALDIPPNPAHPVLPSLPPPLLSESPTAREASSLKVSSLSVSPKSPRWVARSGSVSGPDSGQGSPLCRPVSFYSQVGVGLQEQGTDTVLQSPLNYCVAKIYVGGKSNGTKTELRRKAKGRNLPRARELLIFDETGQPRLRHQIKLRSGESCYPYTWHSSWSRDLEVTFMGPTPESHLVKFYERSAAPGIPSYVFTRHEDYMEFQSQVRGKELIDYFDIDRIGSASSKKEATDQHLKLWKNLGSQEYSISFYANGAKNPIDLEFPISWFAQDIKNKGLLVKLDFIIAEETKINFFKRPSRSSTAKSAGSSISSTATSIFSQKQGLRHQATMTTVSDSRMSVISAGSENSQTQTDDTEGGMSPLGARAKKMKHINIEFSGKDDADSFQRLYEQACKEEASRPPDFSPNWQLGSKSSQKPESVASNMSPPDSPFAMSPELRGQASPVLRPQH